MHYDYWNDDIRRSILFDAKADILVYGMAEKTILELAGKIRIVKVDVDENQDLATKFSIRSIPTLLVMSQGLVKEQIVGALSKAALKDKLSRYI